MGLSAQGLAERLLHWPLLLQGTGEKERENKRGVSRLQGKGSRQQGAVVAPTALQTETKQQTNRSRPQQARQRLGSLTG